MAHIVRTVKTSGGNYTNLIDWESGEQANLVGTVNTHEVQCDAFEYDAGTAVFNLSGWSCNATYYITIQGVERCAMPWSSSSAHTFRTSYTAANFCFFLAVPYTRVNNIQVNTDSAARCYGVTVDQPGCIINGMIVRLDAGAVSVANYAFSFRHTSGTTTISNVLLWCNPAGMNVFYGFVAASGTPNVNMYNCVVFSSASSSDFGFYRNIAIGSIILYNCAAFNFSTAGRDCVGTITSYYCATDQADGTSGFTGDTGAVFGITDNWTDSANLDFSWSSFDAIHRRGLYYAPPASATDILGNARQDTPARWDIGVYANPNDLPDEEVTLIVGGGGDYATFAGWESGEQKSLYSIAKKHILHCYPGEEDVVSAAQTLAGWTTNAAYYITIQGTEKCALPWSATSTYTWRTSYVNTAGYAFTIQQLYTKIKDIQFHFDSTSNSYGVLTNQAGMEVDSCIFYGERYYISVLTTSIAKVYNSIFYGVTATQAQYSRLLVFTGNNPCECVGNVVCYSAAKTGADHMGIYYSGNNNFYLYNTAIFNANRAAQDVYCPSGILVDSNNATSQTAANSALVTNVQAELTNIWTDSANLDFKWTTAAKLDGTGMDVSAYTTRDILGTIRPQGSAYDIGAYEFVAGGFKPMVMWWM